MLSGFFGGKRPPETPPSQGATRGADARARASSSAEAAGGVVLGPSDARSTSERNPERRDPDDIPDGDMPALFERCQDLLAKTTKRADIGAKTVRVPRTLTFRLSFRARRPRGTPQLSNQKTYVSPHDDDDDDDDPPTSLTQPEDESRQFLRLNMIKRLVARLRAGLDEPAVLDAGERLAWAAQIEFLEEDVDRAVERVTGMAHERDPPTPKRDAVILGRRGLGRPLQRTRPDAAATAAPAAPARRRRPSPRGWGRRGTRRAGRGDVRRRR